MAFFTGGIDAALTMSAANALIDVATGGRWLPKPRLGFDLGATIANSSLRAYLAAVNTSLGCGSRQGRLKFSRLALGANSDAA